MNLKFTHESKIYGFFVTFCDFFIKRDKLAKKSLLWIVNLPSEMFFVVVLVKGIRFLHLLG